MAQQRFDDTISPPLENVGRHIVERSCSQFGRLFDLRRQRQRQECERELCESSSFAKPEHATTVGEVVACLDRAYAAAERQAETSPEARREQDQFRSVNIVRRSVFEPGRRLVESPLELLNSPYFIVRGVLVVCLLAFFLQLYSSRN